MARTTGAPRLRRSALGWTLATLASGCNGVDTTAGSPSPDDDDGATGWDVADDGSSGSDDGVPPSGEPGVAGPASLRRLTLTQYQNTVRDLLGDEVAFSPDLGDVQPVPDSAEYQSVAAARDGFTQNQLAAWLLGTLATVQPTFDDPVRRFALVGCAPADAGDDCAREFLARFGRRAFRRPLAPDEVDRLVEVATTAQVELQGDAWTGLHYATATILQSPSMLYIPEIGEPDEGRDRRRYTSLEMASRLAFALTNRGPDAPLLDAGEAGDLLDAERVRAHAERLLDDDRGRASLVDDFFGEYLRIDGLEGVGKDPAVYPKWNQAVAMAMREEAHRVLDWGIYQEGMTLADLLVNRTTFVDAQLADIYGMSIETGEDFVRFDIPDNWARVGLLGLGAFLAVQGKTGRSAPTLRGRLVTSRLLCIDVPAPPADVPPLPAQPEGDEHQTMREMLEQHVQDPSCASCHALMDPVGLALENFDGIGAHRPTDHGLPLDLTGVVDGRAFDGPVELAVVLAEHPALASCLARQMFRYATGTTEQGDDLVAVLDDLAESTDGDVRALMLEIVSSEGFRFFR